VHPNAPNDGCFERFNLPALHGVCYKSTQQQTLVIASEIKMCEVIHFREGIKSDCGTARKILAISKFGIRNSIKPLLLRILNML
jgi:hypothetical protein